MAFVSTDEGYKADLMIARKSEGDMTTAETILDIMSKGGVKASVASALNISLRRLNKWAKDYPDLRELLELGDTHSHAWWFNQGKSNLENSKFNHATWYAIMRNKFGYGDKPSERPQAMADWGTTIMEQLETLNSQIRSGELTADQYEHYMKSILHHTKIYEVTTIAPTIAKMDADRAFKNGELTKEEYDNKMVLINQRQKMLDIASLNLSKECKVKDDRLPLKQQRKVMKPATAPEKRYNPKKKT